MSTLATATAVLVKIADLGLNVVNPGYCYSYISKNKRSKVKSCQPWILLLVEIKDLR